MTSRAAGGYFDRSSVSTAPETRTSHFDSRPLVLTLIANRCPSLNGPSTMVKPRLTILPFGPIPKRPLIREAQGHVYPDERPPAGSSAQPIAGKSTAAPRP